MSVVINPLLQKSVTYDARSDLNPDAELVRKQLTRLATSLQRKSPGAAASLREGMEETLTVQELGVPGALYRTLRTSSPIENFNGSIAHYTRDVRHWKDGEMKTLLKALEQRAPGDEKEVSQKLA